jgi:hypothetical protein
VLGVLQEITMAELSSCTRFPRYIQFRAPKKLPDVIAAAARKKFTTTSEYVRQAVIKELKADGLDTKELNAA